MKLNVASRKLKRLLIAMATALAFLPGVEAQRQGGRLRTAQEVKQLPAKAKRFALVIGVDEYQDTQISRLSGATNDATSLAEALVRYAGFPRDQVIRLASDQPQERQPNRGNILQCLSKSLNLWMPSRGLGDVYAHAKQYDKARTLYESALALTREVKGRGDESYALNGRADVGNGQKGRPVTALQSRAPVIDYNNPLLCPRTVFSEGGVTLSPPSHFQVRRK